MTERLTPEQAAGLLHPTDVLGIPLGPGHPGGFLHALGARSDWDDLLITGALLIQSATRQAGRPITLVGAVDMAWVTRATVEQLRAWAAVPVGSATGRFALTFADGRAFTVAFRHSETAIEAEPVLGIPARASTDRYRLTLRFLEL